MYLPILAFLVYAVVWGYVGEADRVSVEARESMQRSPALLQQFKGDRPYDTGPIR